MSNIIPPLVSSTPPPIMDPLDDDEDDEFGDFRVATESYNDYSLPSTPQHLPKINLDIHQNNPSNIIVENENFKQEINKDFQDKRKDNLIDKEEVECKINCNLDLNEIPKLNFCDNINENFNIYNCNLENSLPSNDNCINKNNNDEYNQNNSIPLSISNIIENSYQNESNEITNNSSTIIENNSGFNNNQKFFDNMNNLKDEFYTFDVQLDNKNLNETEELKDKNEFCNFTNIENEKIIDENEEKLTNKIDELSIDDFGDFESNFTTPLKSNETNIDRNDFDDDFGEFSSVSIDDKSIVIKLNMDNIYEQSKELFEKIFLSFDQNCDDFILDEINYENNALFNSLKDITETHALNYQWSKSTSQQKLLKALNIDMRNILCGPGWNNLPKYVGNVGLTPLEPIKSDILTPVPVLNANLQSSESSQKLQDIPLAEFDWNDSGLINPLDYSQNMLVDLEQLVASLDLTITNTNKYNLESNQCSPFNEILDSWDVWLKATSSEIVSGNEETLQFNEKSNDISDNNRQSSNNSPIIMKNEYINYHSPKIIPLRETHISNSNNNNNDFSEWLQPTLDISDLLSKENLINDENLDDNDDFDDFQMVLPQATDEEENLKKLEKSPTETTDDEFSDFYSSTSASTHEPVPIVPLKPIINYQPTLSVDVQSSQINWPEPGVSDEDVKNIELIYSRKHEETIKSPVKKLTGCFEDDEWTDFVSAKSNNPDMPLSVFNLNQIQPRKQPIPVITPNGLIQTKLPSNITPNVVQTSIQSDLFQSSPTLTTSIPFQPSIISNQFNLNNFNTLSGLTNFSQINLNNNSNNITSDNNGDHDHDDNDDWSDFISSQPVSTTTTNNQINVKIDNNLPTISANKTTNIITNPGHYFDLPLKKIRKNQTNSSNLFSLPDLEFIAPKNRTKK